MNRVAVATLLLHYADRCSRRRVSRRDRWILAILTDHAQEIAGALDPSPPRGPCVKCASWDWDGES
jgi:hypothetical protein